jgi:hypothetical protein
MKSKIKQLRKLFEKRQEEEEQRYYPVIPKRYVDYCEGDDMPVGLFEKKTIRYRFYFTKYPHLQSPSQCLLDLDGDVKTKLSSKSFEIGYNSIQIRLFQQLYGSVSSLDNVWFQKNDEFIHSLATADRFALVAMTNKSQQHIQAYLKGQDTKLFKNRVRRWKQEIHGYLPIFFPLYNKHKKILKKEKTTSSMVEMYHHVVNIVCPTLTDQEIDECLVELVKQIRHIFAICPRTRSKMTLWRGLRSTPSLSYSGFTSMSLNPFHTLNYAGGECCLQKLTILPGTPLLFIGGLSSFKNELECVLPDNCQFYEVRKTMESIPTVLKTKEKCPPSKDTKRIMIQHAVVL